MCVCLCVFDGVCVCVGCLSVCVLVGRGLESVSVWLVCRLAGWSAG